MQPYNQQFSIDFNFPVHFTRSVFSVQNPTFASTVRRLESDKQHRVLFLVDSNVIRKHPALPAQIQSYVEAFKENIQLAAAPLILEGGEDSKNDWANVLEVLEHLNALGIDRQSFVVIIGGGAVLDMACFAAAIAHRGIRAIRIPTTVLAQGDSGVGVKNGINLFGKKNFIGTFAPPFAVINDSDFIATLEHRDKIAGIAEGVKVSLLRDAHFFDFLEHNVEALSQAEPAALQHMIRQSAELHLAHIREAGDPFELGSSRPLDFGHWAAHKLESMTDHRLRHGEAVAIGMALDVIYSVKMGHLSRPTGERILTLLETLGFELWSETLAEKDGQSYAVLSGIREFREHLGGKLHITLLKGIGQSFEVHEMDEAVIASSIEALRTRSQQRMRGMATISATAE